MKKVVSLILMCVLLAMFNPAVIAEEAPEIGSIVGEAVKTDIVARINGYDIPSYNVDGYTYIAAEDLRFYGFDVKYDDSTRTLCVYSNEGKTTVTKEYYKEGIHPDKVGEKEADILYSDIVTYLDDSWVPGCNIGGVTLVKFDCLSAYNTVSYNDITREISVNLPWVRNNPESLESKLQVLYGSLDEETSMAAQKFFNDLYYKYYEYMKTCRLESFYDDNSDYMFERGMLMVDLNEDKIPEVISLGWEYIAQGCDIVDGKITATPEENSFGYIYEPQETATNRYMNEDRFSGIYRNNKTGEKVLISRYWSQENAEYGQLKILTYDGEKFHCKNEDAKNLDEILADYTELDEKIVSEYVVRGWYDAYHDLAGCAMEFYLKEKQIFDEVKEGQGYYYIKNYDEKSNELSLIPVREITPYEHKQAISKYVPGKNVFIIDDEYGMIPDDNEDDYIGGTLHSTVEDYLYTTPGEFYPGVVLDYLKKTPVKAKLADGLSVVYPYTENGESTTNISVDEYFKYFTKYDDRNYYSVVVKDRVITEIECIFHP